MKRINTLVHDGVINNPRYKEVDLHEVEAATPAGYFNYFIERKAVYDDAMKQAQELFTHLGPRRSHPSNPEQRAD